MTQPIDREPLVFERHTETHEFSGTEIVVYVCVAGDRYLVYPPEPGTGGYWMVNVERDYAALVESATTRLPTVSVGYAHDLDSSIALANLDADRRARARAIQDGTVSADAPWTETTTKHILERLVRTSGGTEGWTHMADLQPQEDPRRVAAAYGTNPYRRVVAVEEVRTYAPLVAGTDFTVSAVKTAPTAGKVPHEGSNDLT